MRKLLYLFLLLCFAFVPWDASAQVLSLSTPLTQNNGQAGVTFEVIATRTVTIKKIWTSMDPGTHNVQVYTRPGGDIGTFTGWTLIGSGTVVSTGPAFSEIQLPLNVNIAAGQSMGFFIVSTNSTAMNYTTATSGGQAAWMFSDQNITIDAYGWGATQGMTSTFSPRSFNGRVDYVTAGATNDIGIASIDSVTAACPGQQDIYATVTNFGSNVINFATVNWSWNGVAQTPISITTPLDTFGGAGNNSLAVFLGTRTFAAGAINNITVSATNPNGGTDTVTFNNSISDQLAASLSGVFTINQGLPTGSGNFNSITSAMSALNTWGICGPVEFHMAAGAYVGQFTLGSVTGASATNTITVKPAPSATGDVIMAHNATSSANPHIVRFQGASYITLEGLRFRPLGTSYQRSIDFYGSNDHITIKNCKFENTATSTSTNYSHIYNQSGTGNLTEHCTIEGNEFKSGSYAVYWYGGNSSSIKEDGNKFINNTFTDFYYMGLYSVYQKNGVITGNEVIGRTTNRYSTNYGIYRNYDDFGTLTNNKVVVSGTSSNYGLYLRYNDGSSSNRVLVANNMVSCLDNSGTTYGMYVYNNTYSNIYHNTVHMNQGASSSSGRPIYAYGSSSIYREVEIVNNSFSNAGGGYAAYIYNRYGTFTKLNNNNFFTNGSTFGYYRDASGPWTHSTFTSFQNEAGTLGANMVNTMPLFNDVRDLHTIAPDLDGAGATGTGISEDIDGDVRCPGAGCPGAGSNPDIGADEFDPPTVDAAVLDVSLPCPGLTDIYVTVQNRAINPLNTVRIVATVNGTPTSASGQVFNVGGLAPGASTTVNVGNFNFANGVNYTIAATTSDPNGLTDQNTSNDSGSKVGLPSLGGVLTVGGSNPDFPTLTAALDAMNNSGICAAVTIHIREGIYNEQPWIETIPGASAINPVTIMPDPANTQAVEFAYANTTSARATVFRFNNVSYVTLKDFMISPTGATYKRAVAFVGNNDHITLDGLTMRNTGVSTTSTNASLIWNNTGTGSLTQHCTIKNCTIDGGSYAVYWYGGSSSQASMEDGNQFLNNTLTNYYYAGLWCYYQKNSVVDGNNIQARETGNYSTNYAMRSYYSDFVTITNNTLVAAGTSTNYGLYVYYNDGSSSKYSLIANNMISCLDNSGTTYGVYAYNNTYANYYHNSILVNKGNPSPTSSGRGVYLYGSSSIYRNVNWMNNSVANLGGGPAVYLYNRYNYISNMDNNNWYATGNNLGYYRVGNNAGYRSSLAAWQSATGAFDQQAISVDPSYDGLRDLHVSNIQMDGAGDPATGITTDIDGDVRCPAPGCPGGGGAPDIGADEYEVPPIDLGVSGMINPVTGLGCDYRAFEPAVVTLTNYGSEALNFALTPATISVTVTGASTQSISTTLSFGSIPVGGSLSWPVGVLNMTSGGLNVVTATSSIAGDGKAKNDTYVREIDVAIISNFPYSENFDSWSTCGTGSSTQCNLENGWTNDRNDDMDWLTDANGTSSSSTGPSRDVSGNGNYLYIETSFPNYPNKEAIMNMPCINIGGMTCPVIGFAYHMYGASTGKLSVEVFDGQNWNSVYALVGQQQTSNGAAWRYAQVVLDTYIPLGVIKVRFVGSSTNTFTSDIAIDDVTVLDLATDFVLDARVSANTISTCDFLDIEGFANSALQVQKWDITPGIPGRDWDYISGSPSDRNGRVAFYTPGTYRMEFTGGTLCNQLRTDVETVVVTRGTPTTDFSANLNTGTQGITTFNLSDNTSPGGTDWFWQILPAVENVDFVWANGTNARSQNPSVIFLVPGRYSVRLTVGTACGTGRLSKSNFFSINSLRGNNGVIPINQLEVSLDNLNGLTAYPNPFEKDLHVNFVSTSDQSAELKLSNMIGKVVHTQVMDNMEIGLAHTKLELAENLSAGVYILTVRQGTQTQTVKVIKD